MRYKRIATTVAIAIMMLGMSHQYWRISLSLTATQPVAEGGFQMSGTMCMQEPTMGLLRYSRQTSSRILTT
jgi:hypothetical protein